MQIDIISDLHLDSWFGSNHIPSHDQVIELWRHLNPKSEYLVIAGDIGHTIEQNIQVLTTLKEVYYKEIIIVLGNHDLFLADKDLQETAYSKAERSKNLYRQNGIIVLDGDITEIEGIRFGGAMGWYNSAYVTKNQDNLIRVSCEPFDGSVDRFLQDLWQLHPDAKGMRLKRYDELFQAEFAKLEAIHQSCDVMISHFNPTINMEFQTKGFEKDPSTSFFCFDGESLVVNTSAKLWIFGHTHERKSYMWHDKQFITNTLGYKDRLQYYPAGKVLTLEIII